MSLSLSFSWLLTGGRSDNSNNVRMRPTLPDTIRYQPNTADKRDMVVVGVVADEFAAVFVVVVVIVAADWWS